MEIVRAKITMPKFPKPLSLPKNVYDTRAKRNKQIVAAAKLGIFFRVFVILFELFGVILIHSSALFLDAISSVMDVVSSLFLIFCIKLAYRPPDLDHPFGHGRYEPLGGLILGVMLIVLGGVMLVQQLLNLFQAEVYRYIHPWAWIFSAIAMVILEIAYRLLIRTAKQENSPALIADAVHYRIDSLTSLIATIALVIASSWPEWGLTIDHIGAIVIALFMMGIGIVTSRENFHQVMDRVPDSKFFKRVREAALKASGVQGTEKIRIQQYGPDAHVDIDIEVNPSLTVAKAHKISQQVRLEIQKAWPSVRDVTVHIEPFYANDH
jgi:cation diffusion facilitator family transporter